MIEELLTSYYPVLAAGLIALCISLLSTPWIGRIAQYIGAIDLPATQRKVADTTRQRRIHKHVPALLGGVGMIVAMVLSVMISGQADQFSWGVWAGLLVIFIYGILDDVYHLQAVEQLSMQLLAAFLVVISGVTIESIQVAGVFIDFQSWQTDIGVGEFIHTVSLPGDILTIFWIVALMNIMNWVGGVDGLHGAVSIIISGTVLLVAMKQGLILPAIFLGAHIGAVLGVLPYNYHLSKIFYGTAGDIGNGYILGVMSILAGAKLPLFVVAAALPIFDAIVVLVGRLTRTKGVWKHPWKILAVNDKTHFHHRLLELGFGHKGVMMVESAITLVLCAIALFLTDFRLDFLAMIIGAALVLMTISILFLLQRRKRKRQVDIERQQRLEDLDKPEPIPEVRVKHKRSGKSEDIYKY